MISCDPNDLIALSACIDAKIPPGMQGAVQIYLLQQITGNTMTIEELMGAAACFNAKIPAGDHPGIQTWLLCQIANGNGGGGGSPGNLVFSAANIDRMDFLTDDLDTALSFPGSGSSLQHISCSSICKLGVLLRSGFGDDVE